MGACCTTPAPVAPNADDGDPPNRNGVPPFTTTASGGKGSKASKPTPAPTPDNQGRHWAENSGNKKRTAKAPWQMKAGGGAPEPSTDACEPCNDQGYDFTQTFPMFVMKMETFIELKTMRSHEDMLAEGKVFEWKPAMGRVWFMSHQWTSFSHPDPAAEQLTVAQKLVKTIMDGKARSIFATEEEWQGYITREANRFLNFPVITAEQLAEDAKKGYVWLDYASVPQAREAEEQRANAIDSIPYYVDHALVFLALVPRVEHKDLPGVFCDYKSWLSRGWCRLETQVHELRLSTALEGEIMPGVGKIDVPRRPLVVHSADYATTYDLFDNFYMNWQRKNSVFTGEFACCRLGHKRTAGTLHAGSKASDKGGVIPCDKVRIKPLVRALWDRKIAHLKTQHPILQFMLLWRWATHTELLMSETAEDDGSADDPALSTLEDIVAKYSIGDDVWFGTVQAVMGMFKGMFGGHPSFTTSAPKASWPGYKEGPIPETEFQDLMYAWFDRWIALDKPGAILAMSMMYMVAEGNLPMVQMLHEKHKVSLTLGYMWGITLLDFAAGKGHMRVMRYVLEHSEKDFVNKPSFRERITAVDRACKSGFVDALNCLHEHGANLECRRLNGQTPAHGAAILGQLDILKRLHELGADVLSPVDDRIMAPLDYALYFRQIPCADYLRSVGGEGYLSKRETAEAEFVGAKLLKLINIQSMARGGAARKQMLVIRQTNYAKKHQSDQAGLDVGLLAGSSAK